MVSLNSEREFFRKKRAQREKEKGKRGGLVYDRPLNKNAVNKVP